MAEDRVKTEESLPDLAGNLGEDQILPWIEPPRNPHNTPYVDWLIAVVEGSLPEPPEYSLSTLRKIG